MMFSFWVAANIPMSLNDKLNILVEDSVDKRLQSEAQFVRRYTTLACKCGSEKLDISDLINLNYESMGGCYVNPRNHLFKDVVI